MLQVIFLCNKMLIYIDYILMYYTYLNFQLMMYKQKRRGICLSIKQYFCSRPKQKVTAVSQPESANTCSDKRRISFDSVVQEEQHSTVANVLSVSANHQSTVSYNKTFQL